MEAIISGIINTVGVIGFVGYLILFLYVYIKYDREYNQIKKVKSSSSIPKEYPPYIVGHLMNGVITGNDFFATIIYLIHKNIINYKKEGKDYELSINSDCSNKINCIEKKLINIIFKQKSLITINEIAKNMENARVEMNNEILNWKLETAEESKKKRFYISDNEKKCLYIFFLVAIPITFIMVLLGYLIYVAIGIFSMLGFVYTVFYSKRTDQGNKEYKEWNAFKNYIINFTEMKEDEVENCNWEHLLIYGITFGLASALTARMKMGYFEQSDLEIQNTYYTMYGELYESLNLDVYTNN